MKLYGLIGFPLSHSFSKKYFTEKFEKEGLSECRFENFPITSAQEVKKILTDHPDLIGLGVTIPHKKTIIPYLDEVSNDVKRINACNCVKIRDGRLLGYNTDASGFEKSLKKILKPHHHDALILGTGGSAKAVEYVLRQMNISYRSVSRKPSNQNLSYEQVTVDVIKKFKFIINTTPLGMYPNVVQAPDIPYQALDSQHLLFDLIYNPPKTLFLKKGEERGAEIKNGLEMLTTLAEENWSIWNS